MRAVITRNVVPYRWTWADAATRLAQSVGPADVGGVGYQTDIGLEFELVTASPVKWHALPPRGYAAERSIMANNASAAFGTVGLQPVVTFGTLTAYAMTGATKSTRMPRAGAQSSALAGNVGVVRGSGGSCPFPALGIHWRFRFTTELVSTNVRWFVGVAANAPYTSNVDPATGTDIIGIGRSGSGDSNVQLYRNDSSGTATKLDLGVGFPAATAGLGFQLHLYTPDGTSWGYWLRAIESGNEVSGTVATDLPAAASPLLMHSYVSNNSDATAVSIAISEYRNWVTE